MPVKVTVFRLDISPVSNTLRTSN